jgi:hypothetical protein
MRVTTISKKEAEMFAAMVKLAPMVERGKYDVRRMGFFPDGTIFFVEQKEGATYRLHSDLYDWVYTSVALALQGFLNFPCEVKFDVAKGGRHCADFII